MSRARLTGPIEQNDARTTSAAPKEGKSVWLSWDMGAILAVCLAAVAFVARRASMPAGIVPIGPAPTAVVPAGPAPTGNRAGTPAPVRSLAGGWPGPLWSWVAAIGAEAAVVAGLYSVWQLVGALPTRSVSAAAQHGLSLWHVEQWLHLPSELAMQRAVLRHPLLVEASNGFYAIAHITALGVFLVWLFMAHRDRYPFYRNTLAALTLLCLVSHLYPVAPPRLLPGLGFVDVALRYHQSVYGGVGAAGISDQVSAMPSVHVAWACLIALAVIGVSRSRWRWFIVLHPVLTSLVVVVTANHFWLDGIVAVALLALSVLAVWGAGRCLRPEASWGRRTPLTPAIG